MQGFRTWLQHDAGAQDLTEAETGNFAAFDYAEFLSKRGYADRAAFIAAAARGEVPLWDRFLQYQRDAALAFVQRMQAEAARVAGRPVAFGVNAYNLLPMQLFDAHAIDFFANEVEQFDKEDVVPPVVYRLAEALGRPTFATGTGEDWIKYRQSRATTRVRGWIAQAHAFGQYFMYSWRKWGFSKETGTLWTEVDPEVFRPMFAFVSDNPELFDGFKNAAAVGLVYDNASAAVGRWGVRETSKALLDAGVPYGLVVSGDKLLRKTLTPADLGPYRLVIVPGDVDFADDADRIMSDWGKSGGRFVTLPGDDEDLQALPGRIEVQGNGRVWALPRVRRGDRAMVLHFLNRDYDVANDTMVAKSELRVAMDPASLGGPATVRSVRYHTPGAEPRVLEFEQGADGILRFEVPDLDIWGIAVIE